MSSANDMCCVSAGCPNFFLVSFMSQHLEGITRGCGNMSVMSTSSAREMLLQNVSDLNRTHILGKGTQCVVMRSCILLGNYAEQDNSDQS